MARAAADGYAVDGTDVDPEPYLGYYYHILTKQGAHAPGGAMDDLKPGGEIENTQGSVDLFGLIGQVLRPQPAAEGNAAAPAPAPSASAPSSGAPAAAGNAAALPDF